MRLRPATFAFFAVGILTFAQNQSAEPSQTADWRFAHPNATLVGSIRVASLLKSPLLAELPEESKVMLTAATTLLTGVTEIQFSVFQDPKHPAAEPDGLALIHGHLDPRMLASLPSAKLAYRTVADDTYLLGMGDSLEQAAQRMGQSGAFLKPRALANMNTLSASDLWIAGQFPTLPQNLPLLNGLKLDLRTVAIALSAREDLDFEFMLETATPAMAADLVREVYKAAAQQPQYKDMLRSSVDGSVVRFHTHITRAELAKAMREGMQAASSQSLLLPPSPPRRQTIRIEGLDDGPREVNLPAK